VAKKDRTGNNRTPEEHWKDEPDPHDYPAASDYLSLLLDESTAASLVDALEKAPIVRRKAKDLLRASRLPLLPRSDVHVAGDLRKVRHGECLSPVLLIRGGLSHDIPLVVADGYHRICASYHISVDEDIPCRLADLRPVGRKRRGDEG